MAITLNMDGDFAVVDGLESLSFRPKGGAGPYTLPNCLRSQVTKEMAQGGKLLKVQRTAFTLYQADLTAASAPDPKVDDALVDGSGVTWLVTRATKQRVCNRWHVDVTRAQ